ncbi:hypothetical protein [Acetobacter cibinongensis]|uniref:hypothetical protein n=1 Tax=Acetobacter cibinongensis TaxID=146475 RepID=UPI0013FDA0CA|nr:hypothetical protein [Acetobacter cibinongensis]
MNIDDIIKNTTDEQKAELLIKLGKELTQRGGLLSGSDERELFQKFIERTGYYQ